MTTWNLSIALLTTRTKNYTPSYLHTTKGTSHKWHHQNKNSNKFHITMRLLNRKTSSNYYMPTPTKP